MPSTRSRLVTGLVAAVLVASGSACSAGVTDASGDSSPSTPSSSTSSPSTTQTPAAPTPSGTTSPAPDGSETISLPPIVLPTVEVPTVPGLPTGDPGTSTPTGTAPTGTAPTGTTPTGMTTTGGSGAAVLPEGFPLPPGASSVQGVRDDTQIASTLVVTDDQQAYDFWRSALPGAGYRVVSAESGGSLREIRFSGHGCAASSQIAFDGPAIAVQCDLG